MPIKQGGTLASRAPIWLRVPSLAHDDRTTLIQADDVKRILADIDAHGGN
jgi:hypothetical protein